MQTTTTTATNRNLTIDNPRCRSRSCIAFSLSNPAAHAFELEAPNVVPVEPDEERASTQVIVRHKSPISAVVAAVAIIAHHEIPAGRDFARELAPVGIVVAVFARGERAHLPPAHRGH